MAKLLADKDKQVELSEKLLQQRPCRGQPELGPRNRPKQDDLVEAERGVATIAKAKLKATKLLAK